MKFLTNLSQCDNVLARSYSLFVSNNANSVLGNTLAYFRGRFDISISQFILKDNIKKIKLSTSITNDEQLIINTICLLLLVKSNPYSVQGLMLVKLVIY